MRVAARLTLFPEFLARSAPKVGIAALNGHGQALGIHVRHHEDPSVELLAQEMADLWFHTLALLADAGVEPKSVYGELASRFGSSGMKDDEG